ncbi:MAG: AI-2E family transporter [Flammeovirgaceae bacterium]|nr:AI-2E family transporter [Flammeovirgaceae bacterium]MBE61240.1 AI-2E family transporter [Flammeovirgaceae bacterium]MBR11183.1 AI-2E family transporter [Rickettsiales bacterium]|tara:strand:- start:1032 stop:2156 length:1125 start_codon:yes stop_codon:yes gene_type:complete
MVIYPDMKTMNLSFKNTFFALGTLIAFVFILSIASKLLIPLAYALLIAITLYPIVRFLNQKGFALVWAIMTTMFSVVIVIGLLIYFFSSQIIDIASNYGAFTEKLHDLYISLMEFVNEKIQFIPDIKSEEIKEKLLNALNEKGMPMVSDTISFTSTLLSFTLLTVIYSFLILLYNKPFTIGLTKAVPEKSRDQFRDTLQKAQKVGQKYLTGMGLLMLILGTLNTIGLLIVGIDYAFFFGFLAAILAIIPYIGTFLGGLLPTLYAFMTYDSYWYPIGVIIVFWFVQTLEGNFLSPKIVGGNLNLNAMTALVSLIAGGFLWGISGMILFLPFMAIFKVFCENYEELQPIAELMSDQSGDKTSTFKFIDKLKRKVSD